MRKTYIVLVVAILCLSAIGVMYYLYQKPRDNLKNVSAAYTMTAEELFDKFQRDESAANGKFTNKVIRIHGTIQSIQLGERSCIIILNSGSASGGINCSLSDIRQKGIDSLKENSAITVKGKCTGYLVDVNITDAIIE